MCAESVDVWRLKLENSVLCKNSALLLTTEPSFQAGLELTKELPASSSWVLGLKAWASRPGFFFEGIGHSPAFVS